LDAFLPFYLVGASSAGCSVCDPAQVKLDTENPTYASLAQENGFGSA
jgi:hypothetical protein